MKFRVAAVALCAVSAGALARADVENNSATYSGVQTSYGTPQVQTSYGPPQVQQSYGPPQVLATYGVPASGNTGYEAHRYEPAGYGADPTYDSVDDWTGPLGAIAGYKLGAVGLVVKALGWLVLHTWAIVLGAIATFAFCKVTAVCDLSYHKVAAEHLHEQVRSLVTPERLATASKFLDRAIEKYAPAKSKNDI